MTELGLHNLTRNKRKTGKRVGRGSGSGRGAYSGRGLKGQRARSGGRAGLKRRGLAQMLKSKPKLGGFKSPSSKLEIVNIADLQEVFDAGELITTKKLLNKGLVKTLKHGIKILGQGKVTKKFIVEANRFSESAKQAILEAGGEVKLINQNKSKKRVVNKK
ncbi:MAG: 50S ribosomal protein L15 [Candidatus Buchananbacteria bacterium]|nr:50S ribosomal protein L15 [Candidatus Buchananbacteria bacterium]